MNEGFRRAEDVDAIEVAGEWVVMDAKLQTITKLNGISGALWAALDQNRTVSELAETVRTLLRMQDEVYEGDIRCLLSELIDIGLVEQDG